MRYEYKDEILMNLKDYHAGRRVVTGGTNAFESKLSELDHVYAQAALNKEKIKQIEETYKVRYSEHIELKRKADEYEAKAKAYDRVAEKLYARINHIIMTSIPAQCKPGYVDGLYNALDIISADLESGESDE